MIDKEPTHWRCFNMECVCINGNDINVCYNCGQSKGYIDPEIKALILNSLPKEKDERLNKTSGTQYSPPQLIDLEARGYNQAIQEIRSIYE